MALVLHIPLTMTCLVTYAVCERVTEDREDLKNLKISEKIIQEKEMWQKDLVHVISINN